VDCFSLASVPLVGFSYKKYLTYLFMICFLFLVSTSKVLFSRPGFALLAAYYLTRAFRLKWPHMDPFPAIMDHYHASHPLCWFHKQTSPIPNKEECCA